MSKWTNGSRWNSDVNNISGFLFSCASNMCADKAIAAHNADIDALTAERDEIQRRLDAVVMEHIRTAELKCYCEFNRDHERTMECEYCEEVTALRAIAEGRTE